MKLSLAELGIDPADDSGCTWHPRADKGSCRDGDGNLLDLSEDEVVEHMGLPEGDEQYDGMRRRMRENRDPGAAEDSDYSEPGVV